VAVTATCQPNQKTAGLIIGLLKRSKPPTPLDWLKVAAFPPFSLTAIRIPENLLKTQEMVLAWMQRVALAQTSISQTAHPHAALQPYG
jgi:hypothetical protein